MINRIFGKRVCVLAGVFCVSGMLLSGCAGREHHTSDAAFHISTEQMSEEDSCTEETRSAMLVGEEGIGNVHARDAPDDNIEEPENATMPAASEVRYAQYEQREELLEQLLQQETVSVSETEVEQCIRERIKKDKNIAACFSESYEAYIQEAYGLDISVYETSLHDMICEELCRRYTLEAFAQQEQVDLSENAWEKYLEEEAAMFGYASGETYYNDMCQIGMADYLQNLFLEKQVGDELIRRSR